MTSTRCEEKLQQAVRKNERTLIMVLLCEDVICDITQKVVTSTGQEPTKKPQTIPQKVILAKQITFFVKSCKIAHP
jgi:hypothetical protein